MMGPIGKRVNGQKWFTIVAKGSTKIWQSPKYAFN